MGARNSCCASTVPDSGELVPLETAVPSTVRCTAEPTEPVLSKDASGGVEPATPMAPGDSGSDCSAAEEKVVVGGSDCSTVASTVGSLPPSPAPLPGKEPPPGKDAVLYPWDRVGEDGALSDIEEEEAFDASPQSDKTPTPRQTTPKTRMTQLLSRASYEDLEKLYEKVDFGDDLALEDVEAALDTPRGNARMHHAAM